jgi:hypothetical protein
MAIIINGINPPIPALIGRKRTPAPIAVPYKPNIHMVSVLRQELTDFPDSVPIVVLSMIPQYLIIKISPFPQNG